MTGEINNCFTPSERNLIDSIKKPFRNYFKPVFIEGFGEGDLEETLAEVRHLIGKLEEYLLYLRSFEEKDLAAREILKEHVDLFGAEAHSYEPPNIPSYAEACLARSSAIMLLRLLKDHIEHNN